jgi:NAD(P)-dependent dehydrogenase (short-subunit alcohol dehydrogenase family)
LLGTAASKKVQFVTGAASGIGQATALRIAKEGGRVIAADISKERLDDLVAENAGLDLVPVAGDISTEETVAAVVAAAGGRVDALANVAGTSSTTSPRSTGWTTSSGTASSGSTSPPLCASPAPWCR